MPGIVTNPTAGDVHVNTPLTNFSQKWLQDQNVFQALNAMPNAPVSKQSDLYYNFSRADFYRDEAQERADGTESQGIGFSLSTDPYFARVYAIHKDVTDRQRANQDSQIKLDLSATQLVTQKLMIRREVIFQETFMPATESLADDVYGAARVLVGAATGVPGTSFQFWDDPLSNPIIDVRDAMRQIQSTTGFRPNKMLIGREGWDTLMDNEAILERVIGGATVNVPTLVMRSLVAALFELEMIFVMDSVVNTGVRTISAADPIDINEGEVVGFISADNMLLYWAPSGLALDEPSVGAQFSWTGFMGATSNGMRIKRFRWEAVEGDRIEGQMAFDYRVTSPELGFYFFNVHSPV